MVPIKDEMCTGMAVSGTLLQWALEASPQPLLPLTPSLLPSTSETFRDEGVDRTEVASDILPSWVLLLKALLPGQVKRVRDLGGSGSLTP